MSEIANSDGASETEKPVETNEVKFPPFPDPTDDDFEDIPAEERDYYKDKFANLDTVKFFRLHCTACDRHLGCSPRNERLRRHPLLRTLVCNTCHTFYNSGEFEKGDDGSELYCRWCGQGGQVYCCSDCPHVFCAKCIKRNLGNMKIKEIENADDWKCFKCNSECLKDLRAVCWAVLRYCDLKNKITHETKDPELKAVYLKDCALDLAECCRHRIKRNQKSNDTPAKKKEIKKEVDSKAANIISKMPSTIQVKKFASVSMEDSPKIEKKAQKRSASPKNRSVLVKNPISIVPCAKLITPVNMPPLAKKIRIPNSAIRFQNVQKPVPVVSTYTRIRPKPTNQLPIPIANNCFNGFAGLFHCTNPINDNINLSLESLTQGLDMNAVATLSNDNMNIQDDDVVCTPDFPLEPLCEVMEDNDDDVECITPGPVVAPKVANPPLPPLVPRSNHNVNDISSDNIIQMTDNDVTVNETTGGLKFRVDPQTLSSNKMYRLPDGRIFAINANPNMPGGYSATIVAVTEAGKGAPKGATFAAKVSSISTSTPSKNNRNQSSRAGNSKRASKISKPTRTSESSSTRECDLNVPVEWYRYNLIDAVDALEYSLSRLQKLKKEATSVYLRTRSINEMRTLHRSLERLLNTSSTRFTEIRENLNKGLKQYVAKKTGHVSDDDDDDDDVEILPDLDDDPIFIDENSVESTMNGTENQEVDLTGRGSSECNDSGENRNDTTKGDADLLSMDLDHEKEISEHVVNSNTNHKISELETKDSGENKDNESESDKMTANDLKANESFEVIEKSFYNSDIQSKSKDEQSDEPQINLNSKDDSNNISVENIQDTGNAENDLEKKPVDHLQDSCTTRPDDNKEVDQKEKPAIANEVSEKEQAQDAKDKILETEDEIKDFGDNVQDADDKTQEAEMSEEMIETLLKDDNSRDNSTKKSEVLQVT